MVNVKHIFTNNGILKIISIHVPAMKKKEKIVIIVTFTPIDFRC